MKGLKNLSIGLCIAITALSSLSVEAATLKPTNDSRFREFQYITQVRTAQNGSADQFNLIERQGFDTAGNYGKLILTVVAEQGAGESFTFELPIAQGIAPSTVAKMVASESTLQFASVKYGPDGRMTLQHHMVTFERNQDQLTGVATLKSGPPQTVNQSR